MEGDVRETPLAGIRRAGALTVYELFAAQVSRAPGAIAVEDGAARLSYGELDDRVRRLGNALAERGVNRGSRIALVCENRREYIEIQLAAAFLGAIVACQNWRLAPDELRHCITLVSPTLVIVSQRFAERVEALSLGAPTLLIERDHEKLIDAAAPADLREDVDAEDPLIILYTSGTTGLPACVCCGWICAPPKRTASSPGRRCSTWVRPIRCSAR
jgi:acyl-CoA synthetase (AMP-forming)/AMP-acid ligase II